MRIPFILFTFLLLLIACRNPSIDLGSIPFQPRPFIPNLPDHFPRFENSVDNPVTLEGKALGQKLFFDPLLSADFTQSCATCHQEALAFSDPKAVSQGIDGIKGRRSAMALINLAFNHKGGFFWDGRVATLEEQALLPVEDTIELHNNWETVVQRVQKDTAYLRAFRQAFGIEKPNDIDKYLVVKAIAQYEKTLISADSKFDRFLQGQEKLTEDEAIGYDLFFDITPEYPDAECGHCHNEPFFTSHEYFNNGISTEEMILEDLGREEFTESIYDRGKFRAPTLRNIELTAPYMHDGRFATLEEVIEHYNSGGHSGATVSPLIRRLELTEKEKSQLLAFLKTLTDRNFEKKSF